MAVPIMKMNFIIIIEVVIMLRFRMQAVVLIVTAFLAVGVAAQEGPIQDNSFLVEEAYNQEDGVIQHISYVQKLSTGDWVYNFTDEWPVRTQKHQLSVTMAAGHSGSYPDSGAGWGDTMLNYRYQLIGSGETKLAVSPRLSVIAPTGSSSLGRGFGGWGLQTNLPVSVVLSKRFVTHWNAGVTWVPSAHRRAGVVNPNLGQSTVFLVHPRFNVLCEWVWNVSTTVTGPSQTATQQNLFVNPGIRWAHNFRSGLQIVPGVGVPIGVGPSAGQTGMVFYLSFEHGFKPAKSR